VSRRFCFVYSIWIAAKNLAARGLLSPANTVPGRGGRQGRSGRSPPVSTATALPGSRRAAPECSAAARRPGTAYHRRLRGRAAGQFQAGPRPDVAAQLPKSAQKRLLQHVFGLGVVARDAQRGVEHRLGIASVQLSLGLAVVEAAPLYQRGVDWISGSPAVSVAIEEYVTDLSKEDGALLIGFMGGWTRYALQNPGTKDKLALATAGIKGMLTTYKAKGGTGNKKLEDLETLSAKG
nr:hypothetical protein [Tanacetum cinerariifolium]